MRFQRKGFVYFVISICGLFSSQAWCLENTPKASISATEIVETSKVTPRLQELEDSVRYLESAVGGLESGGISILDESHCGTRDVPTSSITQRLGAVNKSVRALTKRINDYSKKRQTGE